MKDPFEYQAPTDNQVLRMQAINTAIKAVRDEIMMNVPECADRSTAIRELRLVRIWCNAAIALED